MLILLSGQNSMHITVEKMHIDKAALQLAKSSQAVNIYEEETAAHSGKKMSPDVKCAENKTGI